MSTNVPNLKQIGGGHRKNGQKFVDLMWNDPSSYPIFVWGSHSMSPVYFFISYLRLGLPLHVTRVLLHILSPFGAPTPCPPCTSSYPIFVWGSHSMSPVYFFISYLRLGLPLHVPRVLLHILSSFRAPTPCPPCTSTYPIFVWGSHSMSPVYFFISYPVASHMTI